MTDIISYRLSATGVWGYSYYLGRIYLGETSCQLGSSSTVRITGDGIAWYSSFRMTTDIVPGISRRINDNLTSQELYRIIFWRPGLYEFSARTGSGEWSMTAEERNGMYLFGQQGMPVAAITERISAADRLPPASMQAGPVFRTTLFMQEDSPGFQMMVLSFPALKMI